MSAREKAVALALLALAAVLALTAPAYFAPQNLRDVFLSNLPVLIVALGATLVIVTGEIGRKRAKITVHDGRDGARLGEAAFPGANPRKMAAEVARTFWSRLGGEVERGRVPSGAKKAQKIVAEARSRWEGARVPPGRLRLSVGLEDPEELWHDLERALGVL